MVSQNPLAGPDVPAGIAIAKQSMRAGQLDENKRNRHQERDIRERGI